jgi:hypothetical protein
MGFCITMPSCSPRPRKRETLHGLRLRLTRIRSPAELVSSSLQGTTSAPALHRSRCPLSGFGLKLVFEIPPRRQDQNANNRSTKKEDEIHWQYQTRSGCSSPKERSIPYAPPIANHQSHLSSHFSRLGSQDRLGGSTKLIPRLYRHGKSERRRC